MIQNRLRRTMILVPGDNEDMTRDAYCAQPASPTSWACGRDADGFVRRSQSDPRTHSTSATTRTATRAAQLTL